MVAVYILKNAGIFARLSFAMVSLSQDSHNPLADEFGDYSLRRHDVCNWLCGYRKTLSLMRSYRVVRRAEDRIRMKLEDLIPRSLSYATCYGRGECDSLGRYARATIKLI